jgi:molecular chaperone DnaJ
MAVPSEWFEKDFYAVLGVPETATAEEITKAYRRLARQLHPDANPGDKEAEERFKEVSAAYEVVGDAAKRAEYDQTRRLVASGVGGGGDGPFRIRVTNMDDLGDVGFGDLFDGFFTGAATGGRAPNGPRRGGDLEAELHLRFEDAIFGVTTEVHVTGNATCDDCSGTGGRDGAAPRTCSSCGGRGVSAVNQGFFAVSRSCPACGGRGSVIDDPCRTCRGQGLVRRMRDVKVRVPAGVEHGQLIRIPGRGEPGTNGGPAGDLFVLVGVAHHDRFTRKGNDLKITVPVTYPEAVLGAEVKVPTLDGPPVTVKVPPGTPSGRVLRVRGRGVPHARGRGDLLVTVEVAVPRRVSGKERKCVEALANSMTWSPREEVEV